MASINFQKATMGGLKAYILLHGLPGAGKTESSIMLALALVGPSGKVALSCSENERGRAYANKYDYLFFGLKPPFTPQKYMDVLIAAKKANIDCLITDSIYHVWEGEGGMHDMANNGSGKGINKWNAAKSQWERLRNAYEQAGIHLIFTARSKEPILEKKVNGKLVYEKQDLVPRCPTGFEHEPTIVLTLEDGGIIKRYDKRTSKKLQDIFPVGKHVTPDMGKQYLSWLNGGVSESQSNETTEDLEEERSKGLRAASNGWRTYIAWWRSLDRSMKAKLESFRDVELKPLLPKLRDLPHKPSEELSGFDWGDIFDTIKQEAETHGAMAASANYQQALKVMSECDSGLHSRLMDSLASVDLD